VINRLSINIKRPHSKSCADGLSVWACGSAYYNGKWLDSEGLSCLFLREVPPLTELNGSWTVVWSDETELHIAVDRVRSIPLFYAVDGGTLYVSDDAYWIGSEIGCNEVDKVAQLEYLLAGYVTGDQTLSHRIKQVQSGGIVQLNRAGDTWQAEPRRYFLFSHREPELDRKQLVERFTEVIDDVSARMIDWLQDRPVALPLSGGYDSRLIALMLYRHGYKDVMAFSYGRPGNYDSVVSKSVADALDMRWEFVEYSNEKWFQWYRCSEMKAYIKGCDGMCAYPYITSWPAVFELHNRGLVSPDTVFIPGIFLGFLFGGRTPLALGQMEHPNKEMVCRAIFQNNYKFWRLNEHPADGYGIGQEVFLDRIQRIISANHCESPESAADAYEMWEWQERQAKSIANVVRTYDYWGYSWYQPSVDSKLINLGMDLPLRYRLGKSLMKEYVNDLYAAVPGHSELLPVKSVKKPVWVANFAVRVIAGVSRRIAGPPPMLNYHKHPLALYGAISYDTYKRTNGHRRMPHAYWVADKLGLL